MNQHEKLNYVEFPSNNLKQTKTFFENVFAWHFTDYGDEYSAFSNQGLDGGFFATHESISPSSHAPLLVFYSETLAETKDKVLKFDGKLIKDIFEFPGGKRFHFIEPGGNEFAVWSER